MPIFSTDITVLFDDPYWIALYQRREGAALRVCKITFGAQPSDAEVYAFLLENWHLLRFSPPVEAGMPRPMAANPKRRQRQAAGQTANGCTGTRAMQALAAQRQAAGIERRNNQRENKADIMAKKYAIKSEKKKQKHRGR